MPFDVFISYSSGDKPTADAVCAKLESLGIRCWIAPRDIMPGAEYGAAIIDAIHQSRVLVLVFSSHANQSPQIRREVERAVSKGIPIVPLRIENIVPTESLEYFIGTVHWLDALSPPLEDHLQRLGEAVKALLRIDAPSADALASGSAQTVVPRSSTAAVPALALVGPSIGANHAAKWYQRPIALVAMAASVALFAIGGLFWVKSKTDAKATDCQRLWIDRNSYYKSHGYCFQTERGKDYFGNTGCTQNDQDYIYQNDFSPAERTQLEDIKNREHQLGCPV